LNFLLEGFDDYRKQLYKDRFEFYNGQKKQTDTRYNEPNNNDDFTIEIKSKFDHLLGISTAFAKTVSQAPERAKFEFANKDTNRYSLYNEEENVTDNENYEDVNQETNSSPGSYTNQSDDAKLLKDFDEELFNSLKTKKAESYYPIDSMSLRLENNNNSNQVQDQQVRLRRIENKKAFEERMINEKIAELFRSIENDIEHMKSGVGERSFNQPNKLDFKLRKAFMSTNDLSSSSAYSNYQKNFVRDMPNETNKIKLFEFDVSAQKNFEKVSYSDESKRRGQPLSKSQDLNIASVRQLREAIQKTTNDIKVENQNDNNEKFLNYKDPSTCNYCEKPINISEKVKLGGFSFHYKCMKCFICGVNVKNMESIFNHNKQSNLH
jgi:hypothetical protein